MATNGNDVLSTTSDDEVLHGLAGDDVLTSTHNRTTLFGDDGDDDLSSTLVFFGFDILEDGFLTLAGNNGNDRIRAELGVVVTNATIVAEGGAGNDDIGVRAYVSEPPYFGATLATSTYGGTGNDVIVATADLTGGFGGTGTNLSMGGDGDDQITLSAFLGFPGDYARLSNTADGGAGKDVIFAQLFGGGNSGSFMTNTVTGGLGDDYIVASIGSGTNASSSDARNYVSGGQGNDTLQALFGSAGSDTSANVLHSLTGGVGQDSLLAATYFEAQQGFGGAFADHQLDGGAGNDILESRFDNFGEFARHTALLQGAQGDDTLTAQATHTAGASYGSTIAQTLDGGAGVDTLTARITFNSSFELYDDLNLTNTATGGAGNDTILAEIDVSIGDDIIDVPLTYAIGWNNLSGGVGDDVIEGRISTQTNSPFTTATGYSLLDGGAGADRLTVVGGSGNVLDGGAGRDILIGGDGDDTLIGGLGNDDMTGGLGPDTFSFGLASGQDTVQDFELGIDTFALTGGQTIATLQAQGTDTKVLFGDGSAVLLVGVTVSDPSALFVP